MFTFAAASLWSHCSRTSVWPAGFRKGVAVFSVQSEKEEFGRDEALQASSHNQLLHTGNWKETNPCNCVVQFLLSTGYFTP